MLTAFHSVSDPNPHPFTFRFENDSEYKMPKLVLHSLHPYPKCDHNHFRHQGYADVNQFLTEQQIGVIHEIIVRQLNTCTSVESLSRTGRSDPGYVLEGAA